MRDVTEKQAGELLVELQERIQGIPTDQVVRWLQQVRADLAKQRQEAAQTPSR